MRYINLNNYVFIHLALIITWKGVLLVHTQLHHESVQCTELAAPSNGFIYISSRSPYGLATFACNDGYQMIGRSAMVCLADGMWSDRVPICTSILCNALLEPLNGVIVSRSTVPYGLTTFACNDGYQIKGKSATVCLSNGIWSDRVPTCTTISCNPPPSIAEGNVQHSQSPITPGSVAFFTCNTGHRLTGN
eukprot:scpid101703/ scgid28407/ Sushi, von Willebrand factor type A, EGF and pentraxin domain-containing protein 1; CCP module-containing protein 22; Polydom; Selectin-like osteoblast-derived protein; Serologically defined breast cancer antigen NY-BR-38